MGKHILVVPIGVLDSVAHSATIGDSRSNGAGGDDGDWPTSGKSALDADVAGDSIYLGRSPPLLGVQGNVFLITRREKEVD